MKPCSRKAMPSGNLLQVVGFGSNNTVASIKGSVKKLGTKYSQALVVLYNKANLLPIAVGSPDANGNYQFLGLNTNLTCMVVCIPADTDFNALILDRIVPA